MSRIIWLMLVVLPALVGCQSQVAEPTNPARLEYSDLKRVIPNDNEIY